MYSKLETPMQTQTHLRIPRHHRMLLPAVLVAIAILLLPALVVAQAATSGSTLRAVGTTVNGSNAGTSGTNPGFSSGPQTAGMPSATSGSTLRAVGRTVNGSNAGTSGTDPGFSDATPQTAGQPTDGSQGVAYSSNPLNRNPANRIFATPYPVYVDPGDSSSRPMQDVGAAPGPRDTVVVPDPSRDSTRAQ